MKRGQSGINCLIALHKPKGMTSHDCINALRNILHERRIGHAGTLDPLADGVLLIGIGQATRLLSYIVGHDKSYEASITFGQQTTTDDTEGDVCASSLVPACVEDTSYAQRVLRHFTGQIQQVPPAYSAISLGGIRAYNAVRQGAPLNLSPRCVYVHKAELSDITFDPSTHAPIWHVHFCVSKGTYIRSLARDIGLYAQTHAHLTGLKRSSSGSITIADCITLDELKKESLSSLTNRILNPFDVIDAARYMLGDTDLVDMSYGRSLTIRKNSLSDCATSQLVGCVYQNKLYGVYERKDDKLICRTNMLNGVSGVTW